MVLVKTTDSRDITHGRVPMYYSAERCTLIGDSIQCTNIDPSFEDNSLNPIMISVPEDFCPQ